MMYVAATIWYVYQFEIPREAFISPHLIPDMHMDGNT